MRSDEDILEDAGRWLLGEDCDWNLDKLVLEVLLDIRYMIGLKYLKESKGFLDSSDVSEILERITK